MNIYDVLQEIISDDKSDLSLAIFSEKKRQALDTPKDKKVFDLIKHISSIKNLENDDYTLLSSLNLENVPLKLRVRIADILWEQKKDYKCAKIAIEGYWDLFNLMFNNQNWIKPLDIIKRAIDIAIQTNQEDLYNSCCKTLYGIIIKTDGNDDGFLSISFIKTILAQSYGSIKTIIDIRRIIGILDKIISNNKDNPHKIESAYLIKVQCFYKLSDKAAVKQTNIDMAEYFIDFAEGLLRNSSSSILQLEQFFYKAIKLYRNNGEPSKAKDVYKKLVELQKDKPQFMHTFKQSFDASKIIKNISQNMDGLSFEECIIRLSQIVSFYKKSDFKQKVLDDLKSFPLVNMFPKHSINSSGQTTFKLPPLDISNPEKDKEILDLHIHNKMLEYQNISGTTYLCFVLSYIKENFDIDNQNLEFLVSDNFIIPEGRENIFLSAIRMALNGNYYEALHILAPQTENIFRNIAKEVGGLTVTLEADDTSKEKALTSIFDLPELVDCYDNDILFFFKGLLNEQAGANIRNNIAHGILTPQAANSGVSLYFVCAVIKLLVISSRKCSEIFSNNLKFKSFVYPEDDAIIEQNFK